MESRLITGLAHSLSIYVNIYSLEEEIPTEGYLGRIKYPIGNLELVIRDLIKTNELPIAAEINIIQCNHSTEDGIFFLIHLRFGV